MPPGAWTLWMLPLTPLGSAGGGQGATRCLDPVLRAVPTTRQVSGWTENPLAPVRLSARGVPAKGNTAPVLESLHSSEEMVSIHTLDTEHGVGRQSPSCLLSRQAIQVGVEGHWPALSPNPQNQLNVATKGKQVFFFFFFFLTVIIHKYQELAGMWRKGNLVHCWWECKLVQTL